ncbi:MAG: hypothetical protein AM326_12325 [Candidatus Thorarchaeota archaeon SMTZ-45]|nr:MAG: hypothetical protein AM326_12325 [Candidatus Thorarchaeota archaeon SMTZ-45]
MVHSEQGVYIGSCMGLGFWSKLDAVGQTHAVVFDSKDQAMSCVNSWDNPMPESDLSFLPVEHKEPGYASIDECERAGVERWVP